MMVHEPVWLVCTKLGKNAHGIFFQDKHLSSQKIYDSNVSYIGTVSVHYLT